MRSMSCCSRLFLVTLPWTVIGFWNAAIGFVIMRFARDPVAAVTPAAARIRGDEPITASVALMCCIRNEPPARVIRNLAPMLDGLAAASVGSSFHLYVLSDTSDRRDRRRGGGELRRARRRQWRGRIAVTYRRRADNSRLQGRQHPRLLRALRRRATNSRSRSTPTAS